LEPDTYQRRSADPTESYPRKKEAQDPPEIKKLLEEPVYFHPRLRELFEKEKKRMEDLQRRIMEEIDRAQRTDAGRSQATQ